MKRDAALRKVVTLMKLAASTSAEEADSARIKALDLRVKYGISETDVAPEFDTEPEFVFFGVRFGFYAKQIQPAVSSAREYVEIALRRIGEGHVDELVHLHKDMKNVLALVEEARDAAIKQTYQSEIDGLIENGWEANSAHTHRIAVGRVKGDLRRDTIERIVGVFEKSLWKARVVEQIDAAEKEREASDEKD